MSGAKNAIIKTVLFSLVLKSTPSAAYGTSSSSINFSTNSVTVSVVSGGASPFTYSWTVDSIDGMTGCTANSPTSATTSFQCTGVLVINATAIARCTVTETNTGKTQTISVPIEAEYTGILP